MARATKSRSKYEKIVQPSGRVLIRVTVGYKDTPGSRAQKQIKKSKTFPAKTPKRNIESWVHEVKADFNRGYIPEPSSRTVRQLSEDWLNLKKASLSSQTYKKYSQMLKRYVLPRIGPKAVQDITKRNMEPIWAAMVAKGLSPRTIRYTHTVTKQMFEYAVTYEIIKANPASGNELPGSKRVRIPIALDQTQASKFVEACKESKYEGLLLFLLTTGLRIGEALALTWGDIDTRNRTCRVTKSVDNLFKTSRASSPPKSAHALRTVGIPEFVMQVLGKNDNEAEYVFSQGEVSYKAVGKELKRVLKSAKLPELTIHELRHTACTLMISKQVPIQVVSQMVGHHSPGFTYKQYVQFVPGMADGVPGLMQDALLGKVNAKADSDTIQTP